MTSFQLVNHKLKHIFGGLQPQLNFSVESLNTQHKKISHYLNSSSNLYKKIHNAALIIKQSTAEVLQLHKQSIEQTKISNIPQLYNIQSMINQISKTWGNLGQEVLQIKKRIDLLLDNFLPSIKKFYSQHKQAAQQLQHYKQKVQLLQKRINQDSDSQDQARFQRNQQKLKKSQTRYNDVVEKITKKYTEFNNDGKKLILSNYSDFLIVFIRNNQQLRLSVNNWLRAKDKKCICQNSSILKNKIRNSFVSANQDGQNKPSQPICIDRFFKKMDGFKNFKNSFQNPLQTRSPRKISALETFSIIDVQSSNISQEKQQYSQNQSRKNSQNINYSTAFFNKKTNQASQNLSTKVQAAKKVLMKNPNEKPQFKDFLDLMNM